MTEPHVPNPIYVERAKRGEENRKRRQLQGSHLGLPENASNRDRMQLPAVQEGIKVLDPRRETFAERSERYREQRKKYAAMQAHMEMAAIALAAGSTFKLAAGKAGLSTRQVRKYYTDPDFRSRIEELRQIMFSKVRGRVIKELENRTEPDKIEKIELLDLLRVFDRVAGPIGGKAGVNIAGDVNVTSTNYDTVISALLAPKQPGESEDFPIFDASSLLLPGQDPPE